MSDEALSPIEESAASLPTGPGVYLFKAADGSVLYVGKAQNLKSRVRQYLSGGDGRVHRPWGFSLWMAGGGVSGGMTYGATDEFGYHVVENKLEIHDVHATMLHLLGLDHARSTFRYGGRDMRLTDVRGHGIKDIIA